MDLDPEIAAAMGFSNFGSSKRRKVDHSGDENDDVAQDQPLLAAGPPPKSTIADSGDHLENSTASEAAAAAVALTDRSLNASKRKKHKPAPANQGLSHFLNRAQALDPAKMETLDSGANLERKQDPSGVVPVAVSSSAGARAGAGDGGALDLNAYRSGVLDENGDKVFYMPSFIEDPWARLKTK